MAGILDQSNPVFVCGRCDVCHVADLAVKMHRERGLHSQTCRFRTFERFGEGLGGHQPGIRIDVGEDHVCSGHAGDIGRCQKC